MAISLVTVLAIGKGIAFVAQLGFGVFGLAHAWQHKDRLTRPGKIAILGMAVSTLTMAGLLVAQSGMPVPPAPQPRLAMPSPSMQVPIQEGNAQQDERLKAIQRLLTPIKKMQVRLSLFLPSAHPITDRICNKKGAKLSRLSSGEDRAELPTIRDTRLFRPLIAAEKRFVIGQAAPVKAAFTQNKHSIELGQMPGVELVADLLGESLLSGEAPNRVKALTCQQASGGAVLELEYDRVSIWHNTAIAGLQDLAGKTIGIQLRTEDMPHGMRILAFVINFGSDPEDIRDFRLRLDANALEHHDQGSAISAFGQVNSSNMPALKYLVP